MSIRSSFRQPSYLGYLALIRIAVGYHFFSVGWAKVQRGYAADNLMPRLIESAPNDPFEWHRQFILNVVVPNADFFSQLIAYGELAIGLSLIFGCLVRIASPFAAFHNANVYLAVATDGAEFAVNRLYVLLHIIFVITAAGRALGLDGWLHRKFPRAKIF